MDLTTAVLNFDQTGQVFRFTLTNHTAWVFTNHVAGRQLWLQVAQDATGGWTNTWPSGLLWPGGQPLNGSTLPRYVSVFNLLDTGQHWLALTEGLDYAIPCLSNCSYALQFDGSQNYAQAAASASFYPAQFTQEFWFKDNGLGDPEGVLGTTDCAGPCGGWNFMGGYGGPVIVWFYFEDGTVKLRLDNVNSPNTADGQWHHVA